MFKIAFKKFARVCPKLHGITVQVQKNPADLPSRGLSGEELVKNSLWWNGPEFLRNPDSEWPKSTQVKADNEEAMTELVRGPLHVTHALVNTQERSTLVNFPAIIDPKN